MARSKKKAAKKAASKAPAKKSARPPAKSTKAKPKSAAPAKSPMKKAATKKTSAKKAAPVKSAKSTKPKSLGRKVAAVAAVAAVATAVTKKMMNAVKGSTKAVTTDFTELVTPLDDRILVLVDGVSDRTAGGLYIPGTVDERPHRGRVVAVGRGHRNKKGQLRPLEVTVGEVVLFAESAGSKLLLADSELLVLRERDLLGVVG